MRSSSITILLVGLAISSSILAIRPVHAAGMLYVNPASVTPKNPGTTFQVKVKVSNIDPFNAWDIEVRTLPNVINATSFTIFPNLFRNYSIPAQNYYEAIHCVNGSGIGCNNSTDGPGIVHSALTLLQGPPQTGPSSGLLFTITYTVTSTITYSPIEILNDQIVNGGTISQLVYAKANPSGNYGIPPEPDFSMAPNPSFLVMFPGESANSTITLNSIASFTGTIQATVISDPLGPTASLTNATIVLTASGVNSTRLSVSAASTVQPGPYSVTVFFSSGTLHHNITIQTSVTAGPGIIVGTIPSEVHKLLIHAGESKNATITVKSTNGFSGPLSIEASVSSTISSLSGLEVSMTPDRLILSPNGSANTTLTVKTPVSHSRFSYTVRVNVNGSSVSGYTTLIVDPPKGDVSMTVEPSIITVLAGDSASAIIHIETQDYLYGTVNLAASMSKGSAKLNSTTFVILPELDPDSFNVSVLVSIDRSTPSGSYDLTLTVYTACKTPSGQDNNCKGPETPDEVQTLSYTNTVSVLVSQPYRATTTASSGGTILGLAPVTYFAILGVFAVILVLVSVQTYRRIRNE